MLGIALISVKPYPASDQGGTVFRKRLSIAFAFAAIASLSLVPSAFGWMTNQSANVVCAPDGTHGIVNYTFTNTEPVPAYTKPADWNDMSVNPVLDGKRLGAKIAVAGAGSVTWTVQVSATYPGGNIYAELAWVNPKRYGTDVTQKIYLGKLDCKVKVPVPAVPSVNDPCGQNNATWIVPANTKEVSWTIRPDGTLVASANKGFVFEDHTTSKEFGTAPDSNVACPVPPPVEVPTEIAIHKVALKPSVKVGSWAGWRIVVRNHSAKTTTVTVRDRIAGALALGKLPKGAKLKNGVLTLAVNMPANSTLIVTFYTKVLNTSAKRVCNTASVSADGSPTKSSRACTRIVKKIIPPRVPVTG